MQPPELDPVPDTSMTTVSMYHSNVDWKVATVAVSAGVQAGETINRPKIKK